MAEHPIDDKPVEHPQVEAAAPALDSEPHAEPSAAEPTDGEAKPAAATEGFEPAGTWRAEASAPIEVEPAAAPETESEPDEPKPADEAPREPETKVEPAEVAAAAPAPAARAEPSRGSPFLWSLVGAVVGVGVAAGAGVGIPYAMGYRISAQDELDARFAAAAKLSQGQANVVKALEGRLRALESKPEPAPAQALGDLAQRVAKLEAGPTPAADPRVGELPQSDKALADRVAKLEALGLTPELLAALKPAAPAEGKAAAPDSRLDSLIQGQAALGARLTKLEAAGAAPPPAASIAAPSAAPSANEAALEARLAKLESALAQPKTETRAAPANPLPANAPAAVAVAALALQERLAAGRSYSEELATLTRLSVDASKLEALKPFAAKGAPTPATLAGEFAKLAPKLIAATRPAAPAPAADSDWADKWTAPIWNLVKARPVGEISGDAPNARVSQASAALARGDVAAALAAVGKLPENVRALAADWTKQAEGTASATSAADSIFEAAIGRIAAKE